MGTPQQNGVAERKNRHVLEVARSLLFEYNMPKVYWDCAITTAIYLINRMPSKIINFETPLKKLSTFVTIPSILNLPPKIFGCVAYVHIPKNQRTKIEPCAMRCVFVGYGTHQKGYRCYNPTTKRMFLTMDVTFVETERYFQEPRYPS